MSPDFADFVNYPVLLLHLLWVSLLLLPGSPAQAYFEVPAGDGSPAAADYNLESSAKGGSEFGLFVRLREKENRKAAWDFLPVSASRMPLDVLDCNPPVVLGLTRRPAALGITLQTLLYADLKLKALLEEYVSLRERARRLPAAPAGPPGKSAGNPGAEKRGASVSYVAPALQKELRVLEAQRRYESRRVLQTRAEQVDFEEICPVLTGNLASLEESVRNSSRTLETIVESLSAPGKAFEARSLSTDGRNLSRQRDISLKPRSDQTELPWIFKVMLNFLQYAFQHKMEVGVYALLICFVAMIILSLRRL